MTGTTQPPSTIRCDGLDDAILPLSLLVGSACVVLAIPPIVVRCQRRKDKIGPHEDETVEDEKAEEAKAAKLEANPHWLSLLSQVVACFLLYCTLVVVYPNSGGGYANDLVACNSHDTSFPFWVYIVDNAGFVLERVLVIIVLFVAWSAIKFLAAQLRDRALKAVQKTKSPMDDVVVPIVADVVRRVVFFFFCMAVLSNVGFDVTTAIASTSVLALAVAFGAQDYVSVFFGLFVILFNAPFQVGDEIMLADQGISGYVENLSLRYCTVRTYTGTQALVPNSVFVKGPVLNWSNRSKTDIDHSWVVKHPDPTAHQPDWNIRIQAMRRYVKEKVQAYPGLDGWCATRLSLKPEGIGVNCRASFARKAEDEWDAFCDAEAHVVLVVAEAMKHHDLTFATHPLQVGIENEGPRARHVAEGHGAKNRASRQGSREQPSGDAGPREQAHW